MRQPNLDQDIRPLSEFRANAATMLERVRSTKRPLVLTQRGRSAAILVDVAAYEELMEEIELLRDVAKAQRQIAEGEGDSHDEARDLLLSRFPE